ncbi:MAG: hypothetical protein MUF49_04445 [Oculatellaceae cyanobacterium Prado106]|nr:hypothetical protein [Oculatellaceae cyanobacterium Prado106]
MMNPMDINQQIQLLMSEAPQYGATALEVKAIAPALVAIAGQLKHPEYYVLQTLDQNWVMTVLNHRTQPDTTKNIIYVFPSLEDAKTTANSLDNVQIVAVPVPVVHILFQILAMKPLDSIIFFETPGNVQSGTEVSRQDMLELIQSSLQNSPVPPDIA